MNHQALIPHMNRSQKLIIMPIKMITTKINTKTITIMKGIIMVRKIMGKTTIIITTMINTTMEANRTSSKIIHNRNLKEWTMNWKHTLGLRNRQLHLKSQL